MLLDGLPDFWKSSSTASMEAWQMVSATAQVASRQRGGRLGVQCRAQGFKKSWRNEIVRLEERLPFSTQSIILCHFKSIRHHFVGLNSNVSLRQSQKTGAHLAMGLHGQLTQERAA
eukprot:1158935-Pelagomonas_calceolata.AAC.4